MVLEAGVGVDNQNLALTSTLTYYRFYESHWAKVRAYIRLLTPTPASNTILEITQCVRLSPLFCAELRFPNDFQGDFWR